MKVLITGSDGFIAKNLFYHLSGLENLELLEHNRSSTINDLKSNLQQAKIIVHLAGVNRPTSDDEFKIDNTDLTTMICENLQHRSDSPLIIFSSSTQAEENNPYGKSKLNAEEAIKNYSQLTGNPAVIYRFPGIFGKWSKPNYNSVVSTFCNNISRGLPIKIDEEKKVLNLVYIDDVVSSITSLLDNSVEGIEYRSVSPIYKITLGDLATKLNKFREGRRELIVEKVGKGLDRALYSTYLSYLEPNDFKYEIINHSDTRGSFAEMLKTSDSGQISFFTAKPGVIRGGHYHHTKTEKFIVIKGNAKFRFQNILTKEYKEILVSGDLPEIVDTSPGWSHDIENIGNDEMFVMLWANECFDHDNPDTIAYEINDE